MNSKRLMNSLKNLSLINKFICYLNSFNLHKNNQNNICNYLFKKSLNLNKRLIYRAKKIKTCKNNLENIKEKIKSIKIKIN
jgi:hypothetical protein